MKKLILFDFDGVLNDSVAVKTEAFLRIYRKKVSAEQLQSIKNHHLENGGVNRAIKFKYFEETLLKRKLSEERLEKLLSDFEKNVSEGFKGDTLFQGVRDCLEKLKSLSLKSYIVSGAPEKEIREILDRDSLCEFFEAIYDGSGSKENHIERILKAEGKKSEEVLFLGDSLTDYNAAVTCKIDFIAINPSFPTQKFEKSRFNNIEDFMHNLEKLLAVRD